MSILEDNGIARKVEISRLVSGKICYRSDPRKFPPPYAFVLFSRRHEIQEDVITKIIGGISEEEKMLKVPTFSIIGVFVPISEAEKDEEVIKRTLNFCLPYSPVILDEHAEIKNGFNVEDLPAIILTDETGAVKTKICGFEQLSHILQRYQHKYNGYLATHRREIDTQGTEGRWDASDDELSEILSALSGREISNLEYNFEHPGKMAYTRRTRLLAITDRGRKQILLFSYGGEWAPVTTIGKEGGGDTKDDEYEVDFGKTSFHTPSCVGFTKSGRFLLVGDLFANKIKVADILTRKMIGFIRIPLPKHIHSANDSFYIASLTGKIIKLNLNENLIRSIKYFDDITSKVSIKYIEHSFKIPSAVALTNKSRIIVVDAGDSSIKEISDEHGVTTIAGGKGEGLIDGDISSAKFCLPQSVEVFKDALFIADTLNHSIRVVVERRVSTIILRNTQLCEPEEIRLAAGILMVSDTGNKRVIEIEPIHMEGKDIRMNQ